MKKNTREEILKTAKELFNKRGYNNVSTRDISEAIGISKGNLTYHFKRKEDIIEAVVEEMHGHYKKANPPTTLEELNALFIRVQNVAQENAFYYWHYTQFAQLSERIKEIQNTVIGHQHVLFAQAFSTLEENEFLQKEAYPEQHKQLVQTIMLICIYWTPYCRLGQGLGYESSFLNCVWGAIYPLLTDRGQNQYKILTKQSL